MKKLTAEITTPYITLEQCLKFMGLCSTGGEAKNLILDGFATVNGEICTMRGKKLREGDTVIFNGNEITVKIQGI